MPQRKGSRALPVILDQLDKTYPNARYELEWQTPVQLLVATILAAQCTDERVNAVTRTLFKKYPDARAFANADQETLAQDVRSTGYYNQKAKAIRQACQTLVDRFGGEVPRTMEEMLTIPGVARKTANVVLGNAYRIASGVIVDSHVARVTQRLGLTEETKPEKIEEDMMDLVPRDQWIQFGCALVLHGRYTCTSSKPKCGSCMLESYCEKCGVADSATAAGGYDEPVTQRAPKKAAAPVPMASVATKSSSSIGKQLKLLPESWRDVLAMEVEKPYFKNLQAFVDQERSEHQVFPPEEDVFNALKLTPFDDVKVLLLGQDPYHDDGQAHGLCFSVRPGIKPPSSLVNMFKELKSDVGCRIPNNGHLTPWAKQGVLLLNAVLTVRAHQPNSHKGRGWETFTDAAIRALNDRPEPVVFLLWGAYAQKKQQCIDTGRHRILTAAHPSPLSVKKFFGSRPFSQANQALEELGQT